MFCENCGAVLTDGSKFCAQCGSPAVPADNAPAYEPASAAMPSVPTVPDPVAPADPYFPDPTPDPVPEESPEPDSGDPSAEPFAAFDAAVQDSPYVNAAYHAPAAPTPNPPVRPAPSPAAPTAAAPAPGGWSVPGGDYAAPPADASATMPKSGKTVLWIVLGVVVLLIAAIIASAALIVRRVANMDTGELTALLEQAGPIEQVQLNTDDLDLPPLELEEPDASPPEDAPNLFLDDDGETSEASPPTDTDLQNLINEALGTLPTNTQEPVEPLDLQDCADYVDSRLAEEFGGEGDLHWIINQDESFGGEDEGWLDVYLWDDTTLELANNAYSGEEEALAVWNQLTASLCDLDRTLQQELNERGQPGAVVCLNLVDQEAYEYLPFFTVDGEVVYDEVTAVDAWGLRTPDGEE